jgi:hypothetical protein
MNRILTMITLMVMGLSLYAQDANYCGTTKVDDESRQMYHLQKYDITYRNGINYIPLSIFVLGDDDGNGYYPTNAVYESVCRLNKDFEGTDMQFFIKGDLHYVDNSNWYDHEGYNQGNQMMNNLKISNTVNCFIVANPAGNCGYYSYNGDAVALRKSCLGPSNHTWAHELGHFFSLPHTFRGWEGIDYDPKQSTPTEVDNKKVELVDGSNCSVSADEFCDTPADYISNRWPCNSENLSTLEQKDPTGESFRSDGTLFMSYSNDNCANRFSQEQIEAMQFNLNFQRSGLKSNQTPKNTINPENTVLLYPIDGETVSDVVSFEWEELGDADTYMIEVSKFENFGLVSVRQYVSGTSYTSYTLKPETEYFWRVSPYHSYSLCTQPTTSQSFFTGNLSAIDEENAAENTLMVFPNPLNSNQDIQFSLFTSTEDKLAVALTNSSGQIVFREFIDSFAGNHVYAVKAGQLIPGFYVLQISNKFGKVSRKVIVH